MYINKDIYIYMRICVRACVHLRVRMHKHEQETRKGAVNVHMIHERIL